MPMTRTDFASSIVTLVILLGSTFSANADWVRVTCQDVYKYSDSDTSVNCSKLDVLIGQQGHFIPGYSEAEVNWETGVLSIASGGGLLRDVGFNGGESTAYLRKTFAVAGSWRGWLPVTVNIKLNYLFGGFSTSQLSVNLRSYDSGRVNSDNQSSIILRHFGFDYTSLIHTQSRGNVEIPPEGSYSANETLTLSTTHLVHHSVPRLEVRLDLLAWALPSLGSLGSSITASVDANAQIEIVIPKEPPNKS